MEKTGEVFARFVQVIKELRTPVTGCPWDLEQTHQSLKPYIVEETYEVLEAIDNCDDAELSAELGDVLLQVVLHSQLARDRGVFTIDDVVSKVTEKMIRRHPHVFGDTAVSGTKEVLKNWEAIKHEERQNKQGAEKESMLAGVPKAMPALLRAQRLGQKAAKVSFDWKSISGVWDKVKEEMRELEAEFTAVQGQPSSEQKKALEHELGDLLFSLCQLARWLDTSAEESLKTCCARFIERFSKMEEFAGKALSEFSEEQLEALWQKAKLELNERK